MNHLKIKTAYTFFILLLSLALHSCAQDEPTTINLNKDWKFKIVDESKISDKELFTADFNDKDWQDVQLPHTANLEPLVVNNQWQGICWYRRTITIAKEDANKKVFFELEAAMNFSKIWVNEKLVSEHHGGYLPVILDLSNYIKAGKNSIAIRLDNTDNDITGPKPLKRLDFNMYGGLYRNAKLSVKENIHISNAVLANKVAGGGIFITYPKVSRSSSVVKIKTNVANDSKQEQSITVVQNILKKGKVVKEYTSKEIVIAANKNTDHIADLHLDNPDLWSPDSPNLYVLETKIQIDGKTVDLQKTKFGIRVFEFKENRLYVNGEKTFLRGVNRHQEYPFIGYALSDNAQYRDAKKIKEAGFNYIRLSHYPQSPAFLDACDELGLVVIDAIMGWQYYNDTDEFRAYCYRSATQLIRRDRNRPSVLAWEVSLNETKMPIFFMEKLNEIVHAEYPGDNVYSCGWMDDVYDIYLQARQHRILHPHELKDKPYSVSEYGDWEYYSNNAGLNQHKLPKDIRLEKSSRQLRADGEIRLLQQAYNVQESHNDNLNTPAYSDSYWVMYDYNRGYHNDIEASGIMDIFRLPKFAYYFYQSQQNFNQKKVLKIATYWNKSSLTDVKIFSNVDEVKLFLNDELIATQKPEEDAISTKLTHPPFTFKLGSFTAGTLVAKGFINGKQVAEDKVSTPEKATKLKIWVDESGKPATANVNDVLFVYIAAVDANGTVIPDFNDTINITLGNGLEVLNDEAIKAEAGIATAVVKVGNVSGPVPVKATSANLKGTYDFMIK
ncbi:MULTISPECIES: glycoside hydrolase family 2 TIM barrel-domain containing protein [unclassified Cellulophaga]|uniref:glycoside hydrolase family 2 TIM barrel-domain containing protein n=1 Tax=unclassified Cellulophaga TaxID=2634405 RepID=UPI0026E3B134|nr:MULTISPECIES: glycoside hydrolase family 2 TIM barrel-domain containing protein [unclassified Cellulophaga]MDO6492430.1 glycoside hydrolase family 2 TIM barrel-domain containing protein [Cellulophaga sp. 2_MG-2023]MDO6496070.1 glycoside hydrolase family 2 TIM barrel-domain containing protein [Cellulophaga sp. 3_MG-2023]